MKFDMIALLWKLHNTAFWSTITVKLKLPQKLLLTYENFRFSLNIRIIRNCIL